MNLRELVEIVADAVQKYLLLEGLRVNALCFDEKNGEALYKAARGISSNAKIINDNDLLNEPLADILFIDYIPPEITGELALLINISPLSKYINNTVLNGGRVFVLYPPDMGGAPKGAANILSSYSKMLKEYGYTFLYELESAPEAEGSKKSASVYGKNVLSREDLIMLSSGLEPGGEINVAPGVLITDLSLEEAKKRNIKINRSKN